MNTTPENFYSPDYAPRQKWANSMTGNPKPKPGLYDPDYEPRQKWAESMTAYQAKANEEPSVTKIVLTGGPCAGKTTAQARIDEHFTSRGYKVLFVPETATEMITAGLNPSRVGLEGFEAALMKLQREKEAVYDSAAQAMGGNVLVVCDRGMLDNAAYMPKDLFKQTLDNLGTNVVEARDSYDAVFHLVTAANGAEDAYTTANNAARSETVDEARTIDEALISAWTGHPHMRIINNEGTFDEKIDRVIGSISHLLGEPEPIECERKFLIERPDENLLSSLPHCHRSEIVQTYLDVDGDSETRVRQRGENGNYTYTMTTKRDIDGLHRVETERRISEHEYLDALTHADPTRTPVRKTRYCLAHDDQYFEIDIYPTWKDQAVLELELDDESSNVRLPEFVNVIREVTGEEAYKNSSLASNKERDYSDIKGFGTIASQQQSQHGFDFC